MIVVHHFRVFSFYYIMEIFKDIKNYEGYYQVSNFGRVKALQRIVNNHSGFKKELKEKFLNKNISKNGYYVVSLQVNCFKKTFKLHRLIAEAFIHKIPNKNFVNHINGIKTDNRIENLEWCTISENNIHSRKLGLTNDVGYNSVSSKLTKEQIVFITNSNIPLKDLAIMFNVCFTTIYRAKKRITYKNVPL
jgi:hypothetical protein